MGQCVLAPVLILPHLLVRRSLQIYAIVARGRATNLRPARDTPGDQG